MKTPSRKLAIVGTALTGLALLSGCVSPTRNPEPQREPSPYRTSYGQHLAEKSETQRQELLAQLTPLQTRGERESNLIHQALLRAKAKCRVLYEKALEKKRREDEQESLEKMQRKLKALEATSGTLGTAIDDLETQAFELNASTAATSNLIDQWLSNQP